MNNTIQVAMDRLLPVFQATDEALNNWNGDGCLQFPTLMTTLALKMNWDEKQMRENDPFVRWYVRNHPDWHVTRGAHGGIMKMEDKQKKDSVKQAKATAKAEMKAALEAEIEAKKVAETTAQIVDSDQKDSE